VISMESHGVQPCSVRGKLTAPRTCEFVENNLT
jgi:hypothetical protein